MFALNPLPRFMRKLKKITKKDEALKEKFRRTMNLLVADPRNPFLKSHKVTSVSGEKLFSSRVTCDLRIIWCYDILLEKENKEKPIQIIDLIDVGGLEGAKQVYK